VGGANDRNRHLYGGPTTGGAGRAGLANLGQGYWASAIDLRRFITGWGGERRSRSMAAGGRDPWQPLRGVGLITDSDRPMSAVPFRKVKTTAEVDEAVRSAQGRPVLLDFYADWCVSCHEMERYTFTDPRVRVALSQIITLRADVTDYHFAR